MLIENRHYLNNHSRELLRELDEISNTTNKAIVEKSRKDVPTIKIELDDSIKYVHSKYDPFEEAKRFIDKIEISEHTKHVFLFGFGLGYHFEYLKQLYPDLSYSIYEPNKDVLLQALTVIDAEKLFKKTNVQLLESKNILTTIAAIQKNYGASVQLIILPFYEKHYSDELNTILKLFASNLESNKHSLVIDLSFQKYWTLNAIKNLPIILETPSVFSENNYEAFKDKTAIIVSAGPSLNYEFDNLRYIKENQLAYIFSVGSSINSLIENDILPDAAFTFAPTEKNNVVFEKVKKREISNIPLVFGSTANHESIQDYPGKLYHMITTQDTVSPFVMKDTELKVVSDASSIAVVTFQVLANLGFKRIILVGQNLAYQDDKIYADGIGYSPSYSKIKMLPIKDVEGNEVYTHEGFNNMRKHLEMYIKSAPNIDVFNTSKGGAAIDGAPYIPLNELINKLSEDEIIDSRWSEHSDKKQKIDLSDKVAIIEDSRDDMILLLNELEKIIISCINMPAANSLKIEKKLKRFDKTVKKLTKNEFYLYFISPMVRVQVKQLGEQSKEIKVESNIHNKISLIEKSFGGFIQLVKQHNKFIETDVNNLLAFLKRNPL